MRVAFSTHGWERSLERDVTRADVEKVLHEPQFTGTTAAHLWSARSMQFTTRRAWLTVVYVVEDGCHIVVTAFEGLPNGYDRRNVKVSL